MAAKVHRRTLILALQDSGREGVPAPALALGKTVTLFARSSSAVVSGPDAEPWGGHVVQAIIVLALAVGGVVLLARAGPSTEAMPPGDGAPLRRRRQGGHSGPVPPAAGSRK